MLQLAPVCRGLLVLGLVVGGTANADEEAGSDYLLADLPADIFVYESDSVWLKPFVAIVTDYTFFKQDEPSLQQVGKQDDAAELRAARMGFLVRSKRSYEWEFLFAADYQESRTREKEVFQLYDARLRLPIGRMNIDIGKMKQPFSFEVSGLSIARPQQERILSPFFVTRSIGVTASGQLAGDRMTWGVGWFNDWLESNASFSDNANDYVARVTGLVSVSPDNHDFLHLGLGLRRAGPDSDFFQLSGRPESHVADRYVDTGSFSADFISEVALDIAWGEGPFLFAAEHIEARVKSPENGNPRFAGSYLIASWVVTGESRPYQRAYGITGAITPASDRGALELVVRYTRIDLTDGFISGGVLNKWHYGANWWISRQWKVGVSYGDADLDRDDLSGNTKMLLLRLQWLY